MAEEEPIKNAIDLSSFLYKLYRIKDEIDFLIIEMEKENKNV